MPHDLHSLQRNGGGARQQSHLCVGRETTRRVTVAPLVLSLTLGFLSVVTESPLRQRGVVWTRLACASRPTAPWPRSWLDLRVSDRPRLLWDVCQLAPVASVCISSSAQDISHPAANRQTAQCVGQNLSCFKCFI